MSIRLLVSLEDDNPVAPHTRIVANAMLDSEGLTQLVDGEGVVDGVALQSYLTLMADPLIEDYDQIRSAPVEEPEEAELVEGERIAEPLVEPPRLEEANVDYVYRKPLEGYPAQGEAVHPTSNVEVVSFSRIDNHAVDQAGMLDLVLLGDTITTMDGLIWTVISTSYNVAGWYDFYVTPATQSGITDTEAPFTFTPTPETPPEPEPGPPDLPTTTVNYKYTRGSVEDDVFPELGEVLQSDLAIDGLRFSKIDADGVDQSALLELVIPGDTITIDSMVWEVHLSTITIDTYDFIVSPSSPNSTEGIFATTFERPELTRKV